VPDAGYLAAAVGVAAAITFALRAVPFLLVEPLRASVTVRRLGREMPAGIMVILLIYLVHGAAAEGTAPPAAQATGLALTAGLHLWRRNALLSVFAGTAAYVALVNA